MGNMGTEGDGRGVTVSNQQAQMHSNCTVNAQQLHYKYKTDTNTTLP